MKKNKDFAVDLSENQLIFTINPKIYPLSVIYQTAYFFLDKVYVILDGNPEEAIKVVFKSKQESKGQELGKIADEFYNELLNQLLRAKVNQSNAKIREYIVSQALYSAVPNEVDDLLKEVEEEDWQEDPLGIAKTWEQQQEKEIEPLAKAKKGKKK